MIAAEHHYEYDQTFYIGLPHHPHDKIKLWLTENPTYWPPVAVEQKNTYLFDCNFVVNE